MEREYICTVDGPIAVLLHQANREAPIDWGVLAEEVARLSLYGLSMLVACEPERRIGFALRHENLLSVLSVVSATCIDNPRAARMISVMRDPQLLFAEEVGLPHSLESFAALTGAAGIPFGAVTDLLGAEGLTRDSVGECMLDCLRTQYDFGVHMLSPALQYLANIQEATRIGVAQALDANTTIH
jgi:hypothetical protein